ncbi:MAG TPA: hypothetical protein VKR61_24665, partial [Bryobacteraceae bacterium]|nr:hypothetical protein [Bryobacteraceae bacterium]
MGATRKFDLDRRLDSYFATLHASPLKEALKRSIGNWQVYAAVSGSAMAMATGASAAIIGTGARVTREPAASVRVVRQNPASSQAPPFLADNRIAVLQRQGLFIGQQARAAAASQTQTAPSISPGGVVPIYGTESIIVAGEWVSIYGKNLANQTA